MQGNREWLVRSSRMTPTTKEGLCFHSHDVYPSHLSSQSEWEGARQTSTYSIPALLSCSIAHGLLFNRQQHHHGAHRPDEEHERREKKDTNHHHATLFVFKPGASSFSTLPPSQPRRPSRRRFLCPFSFCFYVFFCRARSRPLAQRRQQPEPVVLRERRHA